MKNAYLARAHRLFLVVFSAGFVLGDLISPLQGADFGERPLPKTLDEAKSWWNADSGDSHFVAPQAPAPEAPAAPAPVKLSDAQRLENRKARLLEGAERLVKRLNLPLDVRGYSSELAAEDEYRLDAPGAQQRTAVVLGDAFWSEFLTRINPETDHYDYATYLTYVLLRAGADADYRRHFDAERCAWTTQGEAEVFSPSLRVLKQTVEAPNTSWRAFDGPVYKTDERFRRSLDPENNPARTLQALVSYALNTLAQRAADRYALEEYERVVGDTPTNAIRRRVRANERAQAWNFGRARAAMTMAERIAFRRALHSSFDVHVLPYVASASTAKADLSETSQH